MSIFGKFVLTADDALTDSDILAPESPEQRENCVRNDLLVRLKGVCKDMPEEEFQDLVAAMTRQQLRSERRTEG